MIDDLEKSLPFFKQGARETPHSRGEFLRPPRAPYYYIYSLAHARNEGHWLEFGTHDGTTINLIAEIMRDYGKAKHIIYGFDSFEGLPEDWLKEGDRHDFDLKGKLPYAASPNIRFVKGWFKDTIPSFLNKAEKQLKPPQTNVAMIHIDCDLYSSTATVLEGLKNKIKPGTVIMFDEINNGGGEYPQYKDHEHKAWQEFSEKYKVKYNWLAYVKDSAQASLIIRDIQT